MTDAWGRCSTSCRWIILTNKAEKRPYQNQAPPPTAQAQLLDTLKLHRYVLEQKQTPSGDIEHYLETHLNKPIFTSCV